MAGIGVPVDYFVRPGGSDQNDGSSSAPFLTIQRAVDEAISVGSSSSVVKIHVGHGRYSGGIRVVGPVPAKPCAEGFRLFITGDVKQPGAVEMSAVAVDALHVSDDARVLIAGMTLKTRGIGNLITSTRRSVVGHRDCIFADAAGETFSASHYSEILARGPSMITGAGTSFAHATTFSTISFAKETITFAPGLKFAAYLWGVNNAIVKLEKARIIGSAAGDIAVHINGVLNVSSLDGEWGGGSEPRVHEGGLVAFGKRAPTYVAPAWKHGKTS
jgi:hypothetical protein